MFLDDTEVRRSLIVVCSRFRGQSKEKLYDLLKPYDIIPILESRDLCGDCKGWVLSMIENSLNQVPEFEPVPNYEPGDILTYKFHSNEYYSHYGISVDYHGDLRVISKWGGGPLLLHSIENVPSFYGSEIYIYRIADRTLRDTFKEQLEELISFFELYSKSMNLLRAYFMNLDCQTYSTSPDLDS